MRWISSEQEWEARSFENAQANQPWKYNETITWVIENSMEGNTLAQKDLRKHGYWKIRDNNRIYWSDTLGVIAFKNQENFFKHRLEVGYPEDFSMVETINEGAKNPYLAEGETIT